jgi:hypothetical protein
MRLTLSLKRLTTPMFSVMPVSCCAFCIGQRFVIGARSRLFAQHVLACAHGVDGDGRVHVVGHADRDGVDLRVLDDIVVIGDGDAAAVFFDRRLRARSGMMSQKYLMVTSLLFRYEGMCAELAMVPQPMMPTIM